MTPPTATSVLSFDRADAQRYAHLARHRAGVGVTRLRLAATPDPRPLDAAVCREMPVVGAVVDAPRPLEFDADGERGWHCRRSPEWR
jgi:hypothetical protein